MKGYNRLMLREEEGNLIFYYPEESRTISEQESSKWIKYYEIKSNEMQVQSIK